MSQFTGLITAIINSVRDSTANTNIIECVIGTVIAIAVLRLEVTRRVVAQPDAGNGEGYVMRSKKFLQQHAPEVVGLVACLVLAVALRVHAAPIGSIDDINDKTYAEIMKQWPILLTADSLLALQAMLRTLVLVSSVVRKGSGPTLLAQEVAGIAFGAALGRAALAATSDVYLLDGPLGGYLPVACEVMAVPLLLILCRDINKNAAMASVLTLTAAVWIASRNRLSLAGNAVTDGLFIFAHVAELLAAFAYMSRALLLDAGLNATGPASVALHFAHTVMPVQQCMAAYYFVQAFEFVPELVGAGHPFEILMMGGVAQVGAYAGAAILHMAEYLEAPPQELQNQQDATGSASGRERAMTAPQMGIPQRAPALTF